MSYYDTLEQDLARAKEILAKGQGEPMKPIWLEPAAKPLMGGVITGDDNYAAYKLLASLVTEIERFRQEQQAHRVEVERLLRENEALRAAVELSRIRQKG